MEHYFSKKQKSRETEIWFSHFLRGRKFDFVSSSGVFSKSGIDKGTLLLAENMIISENDFVLDLGCGIGILGIVAAKCFPKSHVVMTEINLRAVKLAKQNAEINSIKNVEIREGNLFEPVKELLGSFDVIVVNPPFKAGNQICFEIIERAKDFLKENGTLQLVAMHNKGGSRFETRMKEVFGDTYVLAKSGGYWVYVSVKIKLPSLLL